MPSFADFGSLRGFRVFKISDPRFGIGGWLAIEAYSSNYQQLKISHELDIVNSSSYFTFRQYAYLKFDT